ncbi:translation initiation factor IF-3 [Peptoniphilus sp. oral taxon 375 str. F0436]|uniref:translation initiation factor IF-3 n=1 Tax=Urinicoccus timonensis TaxID=2024205 RepID=UPI00021A2E32|nr:translation initiation factor IF-3 [Urinicoccus timonensis]EGS29977.1 translation initiation factor IF-3 [Peptoniphilus sp. oral taxon 375 str. F0436]
MPAFILWRCLEIKDLQINEAIRDKEVRLVGSDGEQIGVVDIAHAQNLADEAKLDLVKVAPGAKPPVCRIMDYGKYKYDLMKKEKESKKKQKVINVKELRFSPNIEEHDLQTKANQGKSFLSAGDRVKVSVRFRGRELGHTDIGRKVLDRFVELIADEGVVDKAPKMEGRSMVMFLSPKSEKDKK